jgi:hypothetical protein
MPRGLVTRKTLFLGESRRMAGGPWDSFTGTDAPVFLHVNTWKEEGDPHHPDMLTRVKG